MTLGYDSANNNDLTSYRGAWLCKVDSFDSFNECHYEALYEGFRYSASSIDELIHKLDEVIDGSNDSIFRLNESDERIVIETEEEGVQWVVVYQLTSPDVDDSFEDDSTVEVTLTAKNFNSASKYAEQYLRMKQADNKTADKWNGAEIVSVNQL